jgi:hypothetical protein
MTNSQQKLTQNRKNAKEEEQIRNSRKTCRAEGLAKVEDHKDRKKIKTPSY